MVKENKQARVSISKEGDLVVKNKKFKKSDVLAFCVCLIVALVIWLYATNVDINKAKEFEELAGEKHTVQTE